MFLSAVPMPRMSLSAASAAHTILPTLVPPTTVDIFGQDDRLQFQIVFPTVPWPVPPEVSSLSQINQIQS